jgi:predicted nuclease of predicted toxin-antitoxin system
MSPGPSWSFLLDENVGKALARALRAAGYHAVRVLDVGLGSQLDSAVFRYARVHQHIVVTEDKPPQAMLSLEAVVRRLSSWASAPFPLLLLRK